MYRKKSKDFVYTILRRNGIEKIDRKWTHIISRQQEQEIVDLYTNKFKSALFISEKLNVSRTCIVALLCKNGIKIRSHYRRKFNEVYFDNINTQNKAYFLGFIFADGSVGNNTVSVTIHEKDRAVLDFMIKELDSNLEVQSVKDKPHVRINICSKHMVSSLEKLGCKENKTKDLHFPKLNEEYIWHFVRGFMDGDGCISVRKRNNRQYISLSFVGTYDMMNALRGLFEISNDLYLHRNAYHLHIGKKKDAIRLLQNIYCNAEFYLLRKYEKYTEYLNSDTGGDIYK